VVEVAPGLGGAGEERDPLGAATALTGLDVLAEHPAQQVGPEDALAMANDAAVGERGRAYVWAYV
jgi:hypothetical protein